MVAVTLFFPFSSISFPCFIWPFVLFFHSDVQLDVPVTWQVVLPSGISGTTTDTCAPRSRHLSNGHVLDAGHSTLVGSGYTWPGELCRCVLCVCAYRVKPDFSQGRCGRVNSILEKKKDQSALSTCPTQQKTPIVVVAVVFWGFFSPFPLGGG